jgi:hypothetical protein
MPDTSLQPLIQQGWTVLHPVLTSFLAGISGAGLLTLAANTWITARVKGGIDAKYAQALEAFKTTLRIEADSRLEAHKDALRRSGDTEIEKLRSQLAAANMERTTLLAALTTRRFDAIRSVHARLLWFHTALLQLTAPFRVTGTDEQALLSEVGEAAKAFDEALMENEIFLTEASARLIKEIRQKLVVHGNLFTFTVAMNEHAPNRMEKWAEIDTAVRGPISETIDELARALRELMGDKPVTVALPVPGAAPTASSAAGI